MTVREIQPESTIRSITAHNIDVKGTFVVSFEKDLKILDIKTNADYSLAVSTKLPSSITKFNPANISKVAVKTASNVIALVTIGNNFSKILKTTNLVHDYLTSIDCVSWSNCGTMLACGSSTQKPIYIWDVCSQEKLLIQPSADKGTQFFKWSPDSTYLARISKSWIRVYSTKTWESRAFQLTSRCESFNWINTADGSCLFLFTVFGDSFICGRGMKNDGSFDGLKEIIPKDISNISGEMGSIVDMVIVEENMFALRFAGAEGKIFMYKFLDPWILLFKEVAVLCYPVTAGSNDESVSKVDIFRLSPMTLMARVDKLTFLYRFF